MIITEVKTIVDGEVVDVTRVRPERTTPLSSTARVRYGARVDLTVPIADEVLGLDLRSMTIEYNFTPEG